MATLVGSTIPEINCKHKFKIINKTQSPKGLFFEKLMFYHLQCEKCGLMLDYTFAVGR